MKRHPTKGRARRSESSDAGDPYVSPLTESRPSRRKRGDHGSTAVADGQGSWEWTVQGLEFTEPVQRDPES